jgi:translation initiation factor 1
MERRLVYDSDSVLPGRCPTCGKRRDRCTCQTARPASPAAPTVANLPRDGVVRILRDRKGRGGKTMTVIAGLSGSTAELSTLTSDLKRLCGTGGTLRGETVELQGDVRERVQVELLRRGFKVKLAGG